MHKFQLYPVDLIEINPFTKIGKEWAAIVTESKDGKVNAMTASWGGLGIMWGKNVAQIYIRESRYTKELLDNSHTFSINFFEDAKMHSTLNYLGKVSGRDEDKFAGARLNVNYIDGIAIIDEAKFVLPCRKLSTTPITVEQLHDPTIKNNFYKDGDMHTMYIGEIINIYAR